MATSFQEIKIKTSPLYFVKSRPPKSPPMEGGCEIQCYSGRKKWYLHPEKSQAVGYANHLW
jgi:hypothetical protein